MTVSLRARPRGAPPRDPVRVRADRARPGSRSPAGGSRSTRSSRTSSPARPSSSWSRARERGGELLWVEGQGSLVHPVYSGVTLGLFHGSAPHLLVLCHEVGRTEIEGAGGGPHPIPPLERARRAARADRAAGAAGEGRRASRSTRATSTRTRRARAIAEAEAETGLPADDPVRFGAAKLVDAVLAAKRRTAASSAARPAVEVARAERASERRARPGAEDRSLRSLSARLPRLRGRRGRGPADRLRRGRDEVRRRRRRRALRRDEQARHDDEPDGGVLGRDAPTTIQDEAFLDRMIPVASAHGIQVVFAVYPRKPTMAPTTPSGADAFCDYAVEVDAALPVRDARSSSATSRTSRASGSRSGTARHAGLAGGDGGRARELLRQAQGVRPDDRRDRRRPLAARQRQSRTRRATPRSRPCAGSPRSARPTGRAAARSRSSTSGRGTATRT